MKGRAGPRATDVIAPARPVPPGRILRRELAARGWTQKELAARMRRPVQAINEIIRGKKEITPETAIQLGHALGTSPHLWLNLEVNYRLHVAAARRRWLPTPDKVAAK